MIARRLIYDGWANRAGRGTHRAIDRFQGFCRQYRYCLKCDVVKFFPKLYNLEVSGGAWRV